MQPPTSLWTGSSASSPLLLRTRLAWARVGVLAVVAVFLLRAGQWSLLQGEELADRARDNVITSRRLEGPRGNIYDAAGYPLAVNIRTYTLEMARFRNSADDIRRTVATLEILLGRPFEGLADKVIQAKTRWTRVRVCNGLTLQELTPILERRPTLFGLLTPEEDIRRDYPLGRAGAPIVGYTGKLWENEIEKAREEGLSRDSRIGRGGLERFYEKELRGRKGLEITERDARGRQRRLISQQPGLPGNDLFTTLDSGLQQVAYDLLRGHHGTILAMDPWTGEMLVLAVHPTFNPTAPAKGDSFLNLAVMQHYPPGSPFKIVTALSGLLHNHTARELRECTGRVYVDSWPGRPFFCDKRSGHGLVDMSDGLKVSCNVYFYELAAALGPENLLNTAKLFELDRPTGIDLPGEVKGTIGSIKVADVDDVQEILLGIGQGPLALSPIQVLRMTATAATRGLVVNPHFVKACVGPAGEQLPLPPRTALQLNLPDSFWDKIALALHRVVNEEGGTAWRASFPPSWDVCGKTGTAQRPPREPDAWFVGFAPLRRPEIAFVVMLEHAGHGGDEAAPLARDLLAAWFERKPAMPQLSASDFSTPSARPLPIPDTPSLPDAAPKPDLSDADNPDPSEPDSSEADSPEPAPAEVPPDDSPSLEITPRPVPGGGEQPPKPRITISHAGDIPTTRSPILMPPPDTPPAPHYERVRGGIIRGPKDKKQIALVFTGGEFGEGMLTILDALKARGIKGAFFLTGDYLRIPPYLEGIRRLLAEGHYLGPHSDRHLLYCPWDDRDKTLVTREEFQADLQKNIDDLVALGAPRESMQWWIPPYEWYNQDITDWSLATGIRLFNFTPGTLSHTDYTEADAKNYRDSDTIYNSILDYESAQADSLNGFLLLTHVGSSPKRTDKFFKRLPALLDELQSRGYTFIRLDQMLAQAPVKPK